LESKRRQQQAAAQKEANSSTEHQGVSYTNAAITTALAAKGILFQVNEETSGVFVKLNFNDGANKEFIKIWDSSGTHNPRPGGGCLLLKYSTAGGCPSSPCMTPKPYRSTGQPPDMGRTRYVRAEACAFCGHSRLQQKGRVLNSAPGLFQENNNCANL